MLPSLALGQEGFGSGVSAPSSSFAVDPAGFGGGGFGGIVPSSPERPDVRIGGFFDSPFNLPPLVSSGGTAPRRDFEVVPTLATRVLATDNVNFSAQNKQSEVITSVIPGIAIVADTARLQGRISYNPSVNFYLNGTRPNSVFQRFLGSGTATLIPGTLFVDFRALGSISPINTNLSGADPLTQPRNNIAQNYFATINPYYIQRFGTTATSIIGYRFTYSSQQAQTLQTPTGLNAGGTSDLIQNTGYAAIRTGEDFSRVTMEARVTGTVFTGGGSVTDGAHRYLALFDTRYAVTRTISVLGEIGYDDVKFGGTSPFDRSGPAWGAGVRLDPSPNSTIIALYRRREGYNAPDVNARIGIGERTVFFGRYRESVATTQIQTSNLLNQVTIDELGNPVDSRTGSPTPELAGTGLSGAQNGLFLSRIGVASITQFFPRDTLTLQYTYSKRTPLSVNVGQVAFTQETNSANLIWQRPISEQTNVFASGGYSWNTQQTFGSSSETVTARVGISRAFANQISGGLQYQFTQRLSSVSGTAGNLGAQNATQNNILATLSVRF